MNSRLAVSRDVIVNGLSGLKGIFSLSVRKSVANILKKSCTYIYEQISVFLRLSVEFNVTLQFTST